MQEYQSVSDMALEVLTRQAIVHSERTGEPFEEALAAMLVTEAGSLRSCATGRTAVGRQGSGRRALGISVSVWVTKKVGKGTKPPLAGLVSFREELV